MAAGEDDRAPAVEPVVADLLAAWERFIVPMRVHREGFDQAAYEGLVAALGAGAAAWSGQPHLPMLAADVLIDIFPVTDACAHLYGGDTQARIREAGFHLYDLVRACVVMEAHGGQQGPDEGG